VTTPNRSVYPSDGVWLTELPPVHLWWFSERSMTQMGKHLDMTTRFVDFSAYNARYGLIVPQTCKRLRFPVFNECNEICYRQPRMVQLIRALRLYSLALAFYSQYSRLVSAIAKTSLQPGSRRGTLCAVFEQRETSE
jgi:hypothetical protein